MNKSRSLTFFSLVCVSLTMTTQLQAHHIWIAKSPTTGKVNIYFGEDPSPDQDMFLAGIKGMHVWSVGKDGSTRKIEFTHQTEGKNGWYETATGLSAVEVDCEYGVFGRGDTNMFLHYCAKWTKYPSHSISKSTGNLPIDIAVNNSGSRTIFKVLHKKKPAAGCELRIIDSSNEEHDLIVNENGEVEFDKVPQGRWMVRAKVVEEISGEFNGKKFADKRYYCTLVLDAPSDQNIRVKTETKLENKAEANRNLISTKPYPELPIGITSFGGAVLGNHVYVYGGHCGDPHDYYRSGQNAKLMRLDLKSPEKWEEVSESAGGLQGLAMVEHKGSLYRVGGFEARNKQGDDADLHSCNEFARFDFEQGKWQQLEPMPVPRSSLDAVVIGDRLFVVGGWIMKGKGKTVWCKNAVSIDLAAEGAKWETIETPFLRRALSVGFQGDKLYAVGGMQQKGGPTTNVKVYDLRNKSWSDGPALPGSGRMAGFGSSCFNIGGKLIVSTYDGSVLQLNEDQSNWEKIHQLETGRFFHRLLPLASNKFILVGGANMETGKIFDVQQLGFR